MRRLQAGLAGLVLSTAPGHAAGIVCRTVPDAAYVPATGAETQPGRVASVPADLLPERDAWARRQAQIAIKRPLSVTGSASGAGGEVTVAEATVDPATGAVHVNSQPLGGSPADVPRFVMLCTPTAVDK
jgi:hypothetical protein